MHQLGAIPVSWGAYAQAGTKNSAIVVHQVRTAIAIPSSVGLQGNVSNHTKSSSKGDQVLHLVHI